MAGGLKWRLAWACRERAISPSRHAAGMPTSEPGRRAAAAGRRGVSGGELTPIGMRRYVPPLR
jgi:hypothetical protein